MKRASFLAGVTALAIACAAGPAPAAAQTHLIEVNPERAIEVVGEASVEAAPDLATVTLGVTTTAKDAGEAMAANAKAVNDLMATIKGAGVAPPDIQTSSLSISPNYANHAAGSSAPPSIVGYTVSNMVTVTVRDLSRLGPLLDKAINSGANAMYGIAFGQSQTSALLDKARPLAVADARRKAEIYAAAAGAKIGRLMQLSEQVGGEPIRFARRAFAASAAAAPATPIEAGQDKLTVTVTTRFELTQ